jgi:predicted HAD superfamily Cof-like phosphohydrolase
MNKKLLDVMDFHRVYKQPILDEPGFPNEDRQKLRINLIEEEIAELRTAITDNDIVEIADALVDILYVVHGCALEFGLQHSLDAQYCSSIFEPDNSFFDQSDKGLENRLNNALYILKDAVSNKWLDGVRSMLKEIIKTVYCVADKYDIEHLLDVCHDEIHRSNLSKLDSNGNPVYNDQGKVVKGKNYSPPDLTKILNK